MLKEKVSELSPLMGNILTLVLLNKFGQPIMVNGENIITTSYKTRTLLVALATYLLENSKELDVEVDSLDIFKLNEYLAESKIEFEEQNSEVFNKILELNIRTSDEELDKIQNELYQLIVGESIDDLNLTFESDDEIFDLFL